MIYLLEKNNYTKVLPLIGELSHGLFPGSVCKGDNPGWIYADNGENPASALVYMKGLGATLVGDHNNKGFNQSVKEILDSEILPRTKEDDDEFGLTGNGDLWNPVIEELLAGKNPDKTPVRRFKFVKLNPVRPLLLEGLEIKEITSDLLKDGSIANISALKESIVSWWGTIDRFLDKGRGFTGILDQKVCGWSYSACLFESKVEIYIETIEEYRGKGLGTAIAYRFAEYCLDQKLEPQWETLDFNAPSLRIAEKIGFEPDYSYWLYDFMLDE